MNILTDREVEEMYRDMLDECYDPIKICGYEYSPSHALRLVDKIAYECGLSDFISGELGETLWELPNGTYTDSDPSETKEEE